MLTAALGAGSIIAGLTSSWMITKVGERRLALLGLLNGVLGNLLLIPAWMAGAMVGFFVFGFALPWTVIAVINLGQRLTPNEFQGQVAAVVTFLLFAPQSLAQAAGAGIIGQVSFRYVYLGEALAWLATAIWLGVRSRPGIVEAPGKHSDPAQVGQADSS